MKKCLRVLWVALAILALGLYLSGCKAPTSHEQLSSDASLAGMAMVWVDLGPIPFGFAPATTDYDVDVPNCLEGVTITPVANNAGATIEVSGTNITTQTVVSGNPIAVPFDVGPNTVTVTVTAEDGASTRVYTVSVTRAASEPSNADLAYLLLSEGDLDPDFDGDTLAYAASVAYATDSITVTPFICDTAATATVQGDAVVHGTASDPIAIASGDTVITVIVTAGDGTTTKTYAVTVTRPAAPPSDNANLASLVPSAGTLSPAFAAATLSYTVDVDNATTSISFTPTAEDSGASITVEGSTVASGSASQAIPLSVDANAIHIEVTAEDGVTTRLYTVTVTRAAPQPSGNANLSNLVPSVGTLSPAFAAATLSYTVAVGNATASISFTPTAQDSGATIMVNGSTVASGSASQAIPLVVGANTATIHVTAADGVTAKTYTVVVSRAKPSISGTVNRTGGTDNPSAGAFLAVACVPVGSGTMGQVVISSGSFPLTYTIPDVDSGTYYVVAYFDANGDTELNAGDYYGENGSLVVVSSTSVTGVNVSIDILEDGPITVGLANASAINGKAVYFAIVEHYADPLEDPWLAGGTFVVTGGTGSAVGVDPDTGTPVAFIIGEIYDIYLLVDMNGNWGTLGGPDLGDLVGETTDYLFIYDDLPVYIDYSDLELYEP